MTAESQSPDLLPPRSPISLTRLFQDGRLWKAYTLSSIINIGISIGPL